MDLHIETRRLETFNNWHISFIDKNQLALFGFYYYGPDDLVKCFFCQVEIGMWEEGNDVLTDHIRWSKHCKLICRATTNNVPINETLLLSLLPPAPSSDVYQTLDPVQTVQQNWEFSVENSINNNDFAIESNRLKSYKNWPISMKQKPEQLSDAGFYYSGLGDKVLCYYCGGGLKDWEEKDDPWENHAMWYGKCNYVISIKGVNYIQKMAKKRQLLTKPKVVDSFLSEKNNIHNNIDIDNNICKICFEHNYNTVFIPCGHVIACTKCSLSVTKCPACRQPFERIMNIYLS
jgi:hypothetical protein